MNQTGNTRVESYLVMFSRFVFAAAIILRASSVTAQPSEPGLPATALPLQLVGVVTDSAEPSRAAGLIRCGGSQDSGSARLVLVGGRACDVAEVRNVHQDGITLWNPLTSRLEWLALPPSSKASTPRSPAAAAPPAAPVADDLPAPWVQASAGDVIQVEISQELLHRYMSNLAEVLNAARALPHHASGSNAVDGFEMSRVKPGGIVAQLGIRDGDVLQEYNGQKLDSLPAVTALFAQAQSIAGGRMKVLRDGRVLTFVYTVR